MKFISLISLLALVTACGNPHVSSVRKNIDRVVSPLTEEECAVALSEARVHTEQEQYESVAQCQEQEQQQQQEQEQAKTEWQFEEPVTQFGAKIPEVTDTAIVTARDCNGSVVIEEELSSGTSYVGVTGPSLEICELTLR